MKEREGNPAYTWTLDLHETEPNGFFMRTEEGMVAGGAGTMPLHTWTHVAMTDDGAHNRLYVNGQLVDTEPAIPFDGHGEIRVGGNSIFGQYFDGRIDEVRIYDRALSEGEVQGDASAPDPDPSTGPRRRLLLRRRRRRNGRGHHRRRTHGDDRRRTNKVTCKEYE
jgi:hypothetical protein